MSAAILLAAGESTRMGRPKPLLPWGDTTLIAFQVQELRAAGVGDIVVVLGHGAAEVRPHVPSDARVVVNESYAEGRASSLRAGAAAMPSDSDPIVVLNVDQPRPRDLLRRLLEAHNDGEASIMLPTYLGRRGHPVILSAALLPELRTASDDTRGLRGVIEAHEAEVQELAVESEIARLDVNTEADYARGLQLFGLTSEG